MKALGLEVGYAREEAWDGRLGSGEGEGVGSGC